MKQPCLESNIDKKEEPVFDIISIIYVFIIFVTIKFMSDLTNVQNYFFLL